MRTPALPNVINLTLVTGAAIAGASPAPKHNHQHLHAVKRAEVTKTVDVFGPPIVAFVLDGKIVDQNEICKGIDDGKLQWGDPSDGYTECTSSTTGTSTGTIAAPTATTTPATRVASSQPSVAVQEKQDIKATPIQSSQARATMTELAASTPSTSSIYASAPPDSTTSSDPAPFVSSSGPESSSSDTSVSQSSEPSSSDTSVSQSSESSSSSSSVSQSSSISKGQGLELEFPDGEIDCSTFPSEYGPIEVEWANLGGWAGIQYVTVEGNLVTHIVTAVAGGKGCIPGAMCSYACPPGYQKSQWPSMQGATGQSIGGIKCNANGKLSLTNPDLSKTLCIKGTGATHVQNKLSSNAAICRTDYPG